MKLSKDILEMHKLFQSKGHRLLVVGGAVRDHLMGKDSIDVDLVTDATPDQVENVLHGMKLGGKKIRFDLTGRSFGVMRIFNHPGYEIATFRKDISTGRKPVVEIGATIDDDAMRRDFTINALYYDIADGKVIDLVGGLQDLSTKRIMTPGNPVDRFNEDRLRILRAVRFAARFGWDLDDRVADAIKADSSMMGPDAHGKNVRISQERIAEEFKKGIKQAKDIVHYISLLNNLDLLPHVFPLEGGDKHYIQSGVATDTPLFFGEYKSDQVSQLIAMILYRAIVAGRTAPRSVAEYLVRQCKFPNAIADDAEFLVSMARRSYKSWAQMYLARKKSSLKSEDILEFFSNTIFDDHREEVLTLVLYAPPTVTGGMLQKRGFEGKDIGKELRRLQDEKFDRINKSVKSFLL